MIRGFIRVALGLISSVWLVHTSAVTTASVAAPTVDLGYTKYHGHFDAQVNITRFLGIRYAAAPLGQLRFQAPQPPPREPGVQLATQNPDACYQGPMGANTETSFSSSGYHYITPAASEDCLFLNVFVPGTIPVNPATTGGLPVLVWIHGGGYHFGHAAQYDGTDLVADSLNSVVVVVIQYRLGAFGFLAGNEIKAHGALNAGLLDQTLALQWVQEHIGLFGGDKNHVTIWGESAGGGSVLQHIVANGGRTKPPLFNGAMVSSAYLPPQYYYNDQLPQLLYDEVVAAAGCASSADTFICLQSVDAGTLQAANYNISASAFFGTFIFTPVVDGTLILERPTITLANGQVNGQVLLAVSNQNEGDIFVAANETLEITDYISRLFPGVTPSQLEKASHIYQNYGMAREQIMGDAIFACPTYYLLRTFTGRSWKGLFAVPPADHFNDVIYYFNKRGPLQPFFRSSSPQVFEDRPSPNAAPPYNNPQFIAAFSESFMSLAKYYDVNVKFDSDNITPHWDMYDVGETEMLFNRTEAGVPVVTPVETNPALRERCAFWSSVTSMTAQ